MHSVPSRAAVVTPAARVCAHGNTVTPADMSVSDGVGKRCGEDWDVDTGQQGLTNERV